MGKKKVIIQGGSCVLPADPFEAASEESADRGHVKKDILIEEGIISGISSGFGAESEDAEIISARDCLVIPGGIDPHVHFNLPLAGGIHSADDFSSGSLAALAGGTTTVIDFITPFPGTDSKKAQSLEEATEQRLAEAKESFCDFSLHFSVVRGMTDIRKQLQTCRDRFGIHSCKIYLAYQDSIGLHDSEALRVFEAAADLDMKLLVHAEWGEAVDFLRNRYIAAGDTVAEYHELSRPVWAEQQAVAKACKMAELCGTDTYIVHVSSAEGIGEIMKARQRGIKVSAEACLHHLILDNEFYSRKNAEPELYIMSPPLRPAGQKTALWQYLRAGFLSTVSTDHCPFMTHEKTGKPDFSMVPNGINGVEERMPLFIENAVNSHAFSLSETVRYTSGNAAEYFLLQGKSGTLREGYDADITIIKPGNAGSISAASHHSRSDYNCYEGQRLSFSIQTVIRRGEVMYSGGRLNEAAGKGRFIRQK